MYRNQNQISTEKYCLAALLSIPDLFSEVDRWVSEKDFIGNKLNSIIYSIIRQLVLEQKPIDLFLIATRISNLKIQFENDPLEYLEALQLIQFNKDGAVNYFKELAVSTAKRKIYNQTEQIQKYLNNSQNDGFDQIVGKCDGLYGDVINSFSLQNEPQDLFAGAEEYIESISNEEKSIEIKCPYPKYQATYGGWFPGDLVVFVSPPKSGKSTILLDLLIKITQADDNLRALMIDTELETYRVQRRLVSNLTGVHEYLLKTGAWRNNAITFNKVRETWPLIKKYFSKIDHIYVGNASTEEQHSIIRRWHWKNINTTGKKGIIALDYFKLTLNDGVRDAYAGSMMLGYAVDATKKLASELQCPILAAAQANAADETGLSKEVNKFASSVFLFKRKSLEDVALEGGTATHKLVPLFTRDVGLAYDSVDTVKIVKDKRDIYLPNHINFRIDSFNVKELNTLKEQIDMQMLPKQSKKPDSSNLF